MYCKLCGKKIPADKEYCEDCQQIAGDKIQEDNININSEIKENELSDLRNRNDKVNVLLNIMALFFPIPAIVFAIVDYKIYPKRAKWIIAFSVIGFILEIIRLVGYGYKVIAIFDGFDDVPPSDGGSGGSDGYDGYGGGTLFNIMRLASMIW